MAEEEFATIEGLMEALYRSISGPPGGQDWALSRRLYHPDVRLVRTKLDESGRPHLLSMSGEEYEANAKGLLANMAFYEVETARRIVRFGNIAQVFSAYEARSGPEGGELLKRGMNLAHLYRDGRRWWLMHLIWDDERDGVEVPRAVFEDWRDIGVRGLPSAARGGDRRRRWRGGRRRACGSGVNLGLRAGYPCTTLRVVPLPSLQLGRQVGAEGARRVQEVGVRSSPCALRTGRIGNIISSRRRGRGHIPRRSEPPPSRP